ncbi:uncharacterized protein LOC121988352 [Zingiber officinale]|uniref:uncharacterized protein LOC121988352 n=1 Tax=Zingiber officinale TaxID=94328 RepID=UPI001C4DCC79|nr:uncharacterized protein LOC121988352 [Zingiber officinale]
MFWRSISNIKQWRGSTVSAAANSPSENEPFYIEKNNTRIHIRLSNGNYIKVTEDRTLMANYQGEPGWDNNEATFEMTIVHQLLGDFQLANGYGHDKAEEILIVSDLLLDISYAWMLLITWVNLLPVTCVRIPVGWWIAYDPDPPAPFIGGSLAALDSAFAWAEIHSLKCIIDLHAAPGS